MNKFTMFASAAVVALMAAAPAFAQNREVAPNTDAAATANVFTGAGAYIDSHDSYQGTKMSDIPVASSFAPNLWATEDTCMGSTSFGGQGMLFGFSFGTTWRDEDCVRRKDSRELYNMGNAMPALRVAALSRMCQKPDNKVAMHAAGLKCPGEGVTTAADNVVRGEQIIGIHIDTLQDGPVATTPAPVVTPAVEEPAAAPEAPVVIVPRG